jgi:imidazolonepropionase-like amidohydrolase
MDWTPIEVRGKPEVGQRDRTTGRVPIVFPLSERPPREWIEHFERAFAARLDQEGEQRLGVPAPKVQPNGIRVLSRVSEDDAASWIKAVGQQVADANRWYADNVLAVQERRESAARDAEEADERSTEEMRRFVDEAWRRQHD